ncbi:MAG: hypothetical protein II931_02135 [Clostridia bacterium]|nr:hypothetical protein [Clostridia bacterium]
MSILKNDTVLCTKKRLFLLFMLNMSDWVCTLALLSTGYFEEANPLMRSVIASPVLGFALKILLPLAFILFALSKAKDADKGQVLVSNNIDLFGVAVYLLLNMYHIVCFAMLYIIGY